MTTSDFIYFLVKSYFFLWNSTQISRMANKDTTPKWHWQKGIESSTVFRGIIFIQYYTKQLSCINHTHSYTPKNSSTWQRPFVNIFHVLCVIWFDFELIYESLAFCYSLHSFLVLFTVLLAKHFFSLALCTL